MLDEFDVTPTALDDPAERSQPTQPDLDEISPD
jgi:hypothetical protein